MAINIKIVNNSVGLSDAEASNVVSAIQTQLDRDFSPYWGVQAKLTYVGSILKYDSLNWFVLILDNEETPGVIGYHGFDFLGLPQAKVFRASTIAAGLQWSVNMSHEIMEMLANPLSNQLVFNQTSNTTGQLIGCEVCDPVESDSLGYLINGVLVSDFVLPAWFNSSTPPGIRLDFTRNANTPLTPVVNQGYINAFDVSSSDSGWNYYLQTS